MVELRTSGIVHNPEDVYLPIYLLLRGLRPPEERGECATEEEDGAPKLWSPPVPLSSSVPPPQGPSFLT